MMTGGTLGHNTIALNAAVKLRQMLPAALCRVHINDVRLHVAAANRFLPGCAGALRQRGTVREKIHQAGW